MSEYIIPSIIFIIMIAAIVKKVPVYDSMCAGAADGLKIIIKILPSMICIMSAASMLRASGIIDFIINILSPFTDKIGIPAEIMPMALLRPISGSGSMGILADNLKTYGPDSRAGIISSIIMGSTETTFYTLAVYFGATGVKNSKRAVPCAVIGDIAGVIISVLLVNHMFFN